MTFLLGSTLKVSIVIVGRPGRRGAPAPPLGRRASLGDRGIAALRAGAAGTRARRAGVGSLFCAVRRCAAGRRERIVRPCRLSAGAAAAQSSRRNQPRPSRRSSPAPRAPIVSARHAGVDARRQPQSLRAHRRPDAPHVARLACASGRATGPWTRLADEIGRELSLGRPVQLLRKRSSVAPRDVGTLAAEGDSAARRRSRGPTTAPPSSCATSSRTSAAATGSSRSPASSCAPPTGSTRSSGSRVPACVRKASRRATTKCCRAALTALTTPPISWSWRGCSRPSPRRVSPHRPSPVRQASKGESAPCWTLDSPVHPPRASAVS